MQGQPLVFLATVVVLWVAARAVHHLPDDRAATDVSMARSGLPAVAAARVPVPRLQRQESMTALVGLKAQAAARSALPGAVAATVADAPARDIVPVDVALAHQRLWLESLAGAHRLGRGSLALIDRPIVLDHLQAAPGQPAAATPVRPAQRRWSFYGWSLIRQGSAPAALAAAGQYGGSQAGLLLRLALGRAATSPAAYVRATAALASADDRSLAFGLSVRPFAGVAIDLAVERRLGLGRGQRDHFAAVVAGGMARTDPQTKLRMEGYAQAGVIGLGDPRGFFDLQMVASHPVARTDRHALAMGGGIWAGGQQNIAADGAKHWLHRVDLGPRAAIDLPLGDSRMTLAVDWRHRVDGEAIPVSGAAVTLSAGF